MKVREYTADQLAAVHMIGAPVATTKGYRDAIGGTGRKRMCEAEDDRQPRIEVS